MYVYKRCVIFWPPVQVIGENKVEEVKETGIIFNGIIFKIYTILYTQDPLFVLPPPFFERILDEKIEYRNLTQNSEPLWIIIIDE